MEVNKRSCVGSRALALRNPVYSNWLLLCETNKVKKEFLRSEMKGVTVTGSEVSGSLPMRLLTGLTGESVKKYGVRVGSHDVLVAQGRRVAGVQLYRARKSSCCTRSLLSGKGQQTMSRSASE